LQKYIKDKIIYSKSRVSFNFDSRNSSYDVLKDRNDKHANGWFSLTNEPDVGFKKGYFRLLVYAALFGALSSLLAVVYITLYNQGIKFFEQVSLVILNINIWPLVLLTGAGLFIGLIIKYLGQHGGLGVAQRQYGQKGRLEARYVPRILLQAFISLWSGGPVGPEGPLVFLTGGVGSFIADRLKIEKDDISVLVYSSIRRVYN
jgi:H+/Cl- antiporter ClcA